MPARLWHTALAANRQPDILGIFTLSNELFAGAITVFGEDEIFGNHFGIAGAELVIHELAEFTKPQSGSFALRLSADERV